MSDELLTQLARRAQSKYYGKYRGLVVDNQDPDKLGRVTLRIPSVLGDQTTGWALPCLPFGGTAGLGWFAIPQRDAQVWVEFEEGDLRRPIWTGTFWQRSGDPPQDAQLAEPTTRMLQTPSGHILQFDDADGAERIRLHHAGGAEVLIDENGTITITDQSGSSLALDANGQQVELSDANNRGKLTMSSSGVKLEDGNGNAVELGSSGVKISSHGTIVLDGSAVQLGGPGGEPVLKGSTFLTLLATHVHTSVPAGGLTSPPVPQGESSALSMVVQTK